MGAPKGHIGNPNGRPKGSLNKITKSLKEMILGALDEAGGVEYLLTQAKTNPTAFLTLVGKVLPLTLANDTVNPINPTLSSADKDLINRFMAQKEKK